MANKLLTWKEFYKYADKVWAVCAWNAKCYCYNLFIDFQMNEGVDKHDGTIFREDWRI